MSVVTEFQKGILSLIKSAISGQEAVLPDEFDWEEALRVGDRHKISALLDYGVLHSPHLAIPKEIQTTLENSLYTVYTVDHYHKNEIERISAVFNQNGIRHMFLKGSILKNIYPKSEMRRMGDIDILISMEQYSQITNLMREMGFVMQYETAHELVWQKAGFIHVELHKRLIDPENRIFAEYYRDPWQKAIPAGGKTPYTYFLSDEDFFIHLFLHFTKHVYVAGIGLQHVVDLWVYLNAKKDMDQNYLRGELERLHLLTFYGYILQTLCVWFEGEKPNECTDFITKKIFSDGVYGDSNNWASYYALQMSRDFQSPFRRFRRLVRLIFPTLESMYKPYPILHSAPFLLPIFWFIRPFDIVIRRRGSLTKRAKYNKLITKENVKKQIEMLKKIGLNFE